jgi:hypothetical protein
MPCCGCCVFSSNCLLLELLGNVLSSFEEEFFSLLCDLSFVPQPLYLRVLGVGLLE